MTKERHIKIHKKLHKYLDELCADFFVHTNKLFSKTPISELMSWSYEQTINSDMRTKIKMEEIMDKEKVKQSEECKNGGTVAFSPITEETIQLYKNDNVKATGEGARSGFDMSNEIIQECPILALKLFKRLLWMTEVEQALEEHPEDYEFEVTVIKKKVKQPKLLKEKR